MTCCLYKKVSLERRKAPFWSEISNSKYFSVSLAQLWVVTHLSVVSGKRAETHHLTILQSAEHSETGSLSAQPVRTQNAQNGEQGSLKSLRSAFGVFILVFFYLFTLYLLVNTSIVTQ